MSGSWTPGPGPTGGDDTFVGTAGTNIAFGLGGNDSLAGGAGGDLLSGDAGNDTLFGNGGDDVLLGGDGNDLINGGAGTDAIFGGGGADTFYYNVGDGQDTIFGGSGADQLVIYAPAGFTTVAGGGGLTQVNINGGGTFYYSGIETVVSSLTPLPCYAEGTLIATQRGEVPVEALRVGDLVVSPHGRAGVLQPIVWLGHARVDVARHPDRDAVAPIRIRAGALGAGMPVRDLRVSPDHALFLDGHLVPAGLLVNGAGITRDSHAAAVTYWHVELPAHGLLVAEGAVAESYYDDGNRKQFDNFGVVALFKDFRRVRGNYEAEACFPVLRDGPALQRLRMRLAVLPAAPDAAPALRRA